MDVAAATILLTKRRISGKSIGIGGGIIGIIIAAVITFMSGGGIDDVARSALNQLSIDGSGSNEYAPDAEDERLATITSQILAGTEDVWSREFEKQGWGKYTPPQWCSIMEVYRRGADKARHRWAPSTAQPTKQCT